MLYDIIPCLNALKLKYFWSDILSHFHEHFIFDYNLVDWERLSKEIRKNTLNSRADDVLDELLLSRLDNRKRQEDEASILSSY
ncbi:hypothetical protein INT48_002672 [Thamnidium elegans]|uniref:Uncharacterized protein n=1 Tax=Thamnidium elegans TaxID=101142 RepID=A0A8H7W360_9FUNG|nr:hypothetical protein INT48_002672 [Thamnidium elegans]